MAVFGRRRRRAVDRVDARARRFWSWWAGARDTVATAVEAGAATRLRSLVEPRVRDYHRELTWHVGPGPGARWMLVLSGSRHPALRGVAERWRMAGPADDGDWEYHPAFPPEPGAFRSPVRIGDLDLDPAQATALAVPDDQRFRLDLTVHHPVFEHLSDLSRSRVANVMVGWALGEDETDRWVGKISATTRRPLDAVPLSLLSTVTAQLATRWGGERWATLEGSFDDRRLIAAVRHPLHRVDYPLFDEHIAVRLPYTDTMSDGLPTERSLGDLLSFERNLADRLGDQALLVAQQTTSGERLLHFYADSTASPLPMIRAMLGGYVGPPVTVTAQDDPGWESIDHLRP